MTISAQESDYNTLHEAIEAVSFDYEPLRSRAEITEYYQDTYGPDWKSHIVDKIVDLTGGKRASVSREFQKNTKTGEDRYKSAKINQKTRDKYEQLGKSLPPKQIPKNLAGKRATVTVGAKLWISKKPYYKNFTKELTEQQTAEMLEGSFDSMIEAYGINPGSVEEIELDSLSISFD